MDGICVKCESTLVEMVGLLIREAKGKSNTGGGL